MSVVIVVKVSEGVVLGADSAATISGRVEGPLGVQEGVLKNYYNAKKLLQVGNFPIGVLTWGMGQVGLRTVESLIREWEHDQYWESVNSYRKHHNQGNRQYTVEGCAESLRAQLHRAYSQIQEINDLPSDHRPSVGFIVSGYSEGRFFPEIWRFAIPLDSRVINQRPDVDGKPDFGASWFGLTDAIVRLHWGRDDLVPKILSEKLGIPEQDVRSALEPLQYQIPFAVMPLQDAIDYAHYMLSVALGRYRFVLGPELCGGQIEIAAIAQGEFRWISRKSWNLEQGG